MAKKPKNTDNDDKNKTDDILLEETILEIGPNDTAKLSTTDANTVEKEIDEIDSIDMSISSIVPDGYSLSKETIDDSASSSETSTDLSNTISKKQTDSSHTDTLIDSTNLFVDKNSTENSSKSNFATNTNGNSTRVRSHVSVGNNAFTPVNRLDRTSANLPTSNSSSKPRATIDKSNNNSKPNSIKNGNTPTKEEPIDVARQRKQDNARRSRRRSKQALGFILSIFILVGAFTIVRGGISVYQNFTDNSDQMKVYEDRIAPLVWFDLLPFENPSQIDENSLKEALIFGIIYNMKDEIQYDEQGSAIIPAIEVDQAAAELFGPDFSFSSHAEFTSIAQGITYNYDETLNAYIVLGTGLELSYSPRVKEIKKESGGVLRVTVGYLSTKSSDGNLLPTLDEENPVRYMDFMFQRDGSEYYLYAMQPNTTISVSTSSSSSSSSSSTYEDSSAISSRISSASGNEDETISIDENFVVSLGDVEGGFGTDETNSVSNATTSSSSSANADTTEKPLPEDDAESVSVAA